MKEGREGEGGRYQGREWGIKGGKEGRMDGGDDGREGGIEGGREGERDRGSDGSRAWWIEGKGRAEWRTGVWEGRREGRR